jgi:hypothetical protein
MHKTESATCFTNEIRKRWPRWTPSDVEASDWLVWLEKYDYADIAEAARAHLAESRYTKPIPAQLLDHARAIRTRNRPKRERRDQTKSSGIPDEHTFIMCVGKSDNGRGPVGTFVPILLWPFKVRWTPEDYRRVAEEQCVIHSRNGRNGVWEAFYNTTHLEMMRRRTRLRNS